MNKWLIGAALIFVAGSSYAQMTPEEQAVATAVQGIEGGTSSTNANSLLLRNAIATWEHKKDEEIAALKVQIGAEDKRIQELQAQLAEKEKPPAKPAGGEQK